ncbi:hypothetical protein [uncultured Chryseobacterium sp.]|uniref:hypothetical protein n=1 Tax=uncultured Chryseobacterium sp. TaxID=259322 RepID=UPI0025D518FE|nr:hypothetical protein [uncultured Chryseobacterium sp.]
MKKVLFLLPLALLSCKKDPEVTVNQKKDSTVVSENPGPVEKSDSAAVRMKDSIINNAPKTKEVLRTGVMREVKEGQITRTIDAAQLPVRLGEEFTTDGQEFILKITGFSKSDIKAAISTKEKDFNIRFNQIRLPNGDYDGPFGREITYNVKGEGEVWLIIGKSNMASGKTKGSFTVAVE